MIPSVERNVRCAWRQKCVRHSANVEVLVVVVVVIVETCHTGNPPAAGDIIVTRCHVAREAGASSPAVVARGLALGKGQPSCCRVRRVHSAVGDEGVIVSLADLKREFSA